MVLRLLVLYISISIVNGFIEIPEWLKGSSKPIKNGDDYGVDVTFPIHHYLDPKSEYDVRYRNMMKGCYEKYSRRECDITESQRIDMNMDQPKTEHNYTEYGFQKLKAPPKLWDLLSTFYETNKDKAQLENWPRGNTYTNHWDAPTEFISVENAQLEGGGERLKQEIWNEMKPVLEEWVAEELTPTSLYGIRVYRRGAMLSTHVDRLPLVTSAIVQVAQSGMDEPWPIEVYSHDGKAYNVTMQPGEMVLYESHTVLHGRPFPLLGDTYANIFIHFKPLRHDAINEEDRRIMQQAGTNRRSLRKSILLSQDGKGLGEGGRDSSNKEGSGEEEQEAQEKEDPLAKFGGPKVHSVRDDQRLIAAHRKARLDKAAAEAIARASGSKNSKSSDKMSQQQHEHDHDYLQYTNVPPLAKKWNDVLKKKDLQDMASMDGSGSSGGNAGGSSSDLEGEDSSSSPGRFRTILHQVAQMGDLDTLSKLLKGKTPADVEILINAKDAHGWQPLHEAVRKGHYRCVKYLIDVCGADIGSATDRGGTPLWWAKKLLDPRHPIIAYLEEIGAPDIGDE